MTGGEGGRRGGRRVDRGPRPIGEALRGFVREAGMAEAGADALYARWQEIAGEAVSRHVVPVRLAGGTLVVEADHPAWATQVRLLEADLLARVGEVLGTDPPTAVEIRIRRR